MRLFESNTFLIGPRASTACSAFRLWKKLRSVGTYINGYADSVLHEVGTEESDPFVADMNNSIQHYALQQFNLNAIAYYWNGWVPSNGPGAVILREVLLRGPVHAVSQI